MRAGGGAGVGGEEAGPRARRGSSWAAASLLLGIGVCCPVMSFAAILAGLRGLVEIKSNPGMAGRRTAIAGIVLGMAAIAFWAAAAMLWHINARTPMLTGPQRELEAGFAGEIGKFKRGFTEAGENASDDEAKRFLAALSQRFGRFRGSMQDPAATAPSSMDGPTVFRIAYQLDFEGQPVKAEAAFRTFGDPKAFVPSLVFDWEWIRIDDPVGQGGSVGRGNLVYPEAARAAAEAAPPASQPVSTRP